MDKKNSTIIVLSFIVVVLSTTLVVLFNTEVDTNSAEMKKFVGVWVPSVRLIMGETTYHFREDGIFVQQDEFLNLEDTSDEPKNFYKTERRNGTYEVQDGKLIITFEDSEVIVYNYIFSNNNSVILIDDDSLEKIYNNEDNSHILRYTWLRQ